MSPGCDILLLAHTLASKRPKQKVECSVIATLLSYALYALHFLASGSLTSKLTSFFLFTIAQRKRGLKFDAHGLTLILALQLVPLWHSLIFSMFFF